MRISDWSSDVCSSYLVLRKASELAAAGQRRSELRTDVVEERAVVRLAGDSRIRFESARREVDTRLVIDCHANKRWDTLVLRRRRSEDRKRVVRGQRGTGGSDPGGGGWHKNTTTN